MSKNKKKSCHGVCNDCSSELTYEKREDVHYIYCECDNSRVAFAVTCKYFAVGNWKKKIYKEK